MAEKGMINITGAAEGCVAPIISDLINEKKGQSLIVVSTFNRAKRLAADLSFLIRAISTYCRRRKRLSCSMKREAMMICWNA